MKRGVATMILALGLLGAPAEAAKNRCNLKGARTVVSTAKARVFFVAGKGAVQRRWFGCLTGRKPFLLAIDAAPKDPESDRTTNDTFRLGGTWVGWHYTIANDSGVGEFASGVVVRSLAGAKRAVRQDISRYALKNFKIAGNGDVAWVLASGNFREVDGVAHTTSIPTPLAVAVGIDSESLTLAGGKVGFTQSGEKRSVTLAPPAAPATGTAVGPQGLDGRFGDCGTLVPASPRPNVFTEATQLAAAPGGAFVAAGTTTSGKGDPLQQDRLVISRFSAGGQFDSTFGGSGVVQLEVPAPKGARDVHLTGLVVQPDGKVVVAGSQDLSGADAARAVVVRYNADGTLDETFAGDGILEDAVPAQNAVHINDIALTATGAFVVVGERDGVYFAARLLPEGSLDATFGTSGLTVDPGKDGSALNAVAAQSDGTVFAGGGGSGQPLLLRLTKDGALLSVSSAGPPATAAISALEATGDGGVVAIGTGANITQVDQAMLARYTAEGKPATGFDGDGFVLDPQISSPSDIAIGPDGSLYVTASFNLMPGGYAGSGLVHYSAGGARDTAFGIRGALGGTSSFGLKNGDVMVRDDGTALVAQDNGGAYAVSRFAVRGPATGATAERSTVCAMATVTKIVPLLKTRKLDVALRLRAPGKLRLEAFVMVGKNTVRLGRIDVFRPYTEGAVATIPLSKNAGILLRNAKSAKLTVTGGAPGKTKTTYRATLTR